MIISDTAVPISIFSVGWMGEKRCWGLWPMVLRVDRDTTFVTIYDTSAFGFARVWNGIGLNVGKNLSVIKVAIIARRRISSMFLARLLPLFLNCWFSINHLVVFHHVLYRENCVCKTLKRVFRWQATNRVLIQNIWRCPEPDDLAA